MFDTHRYDLSFVIPERTQTAPELVFSINQHHLPELQERFATLARRFPEHFTRYFGEFDTPFETFNQNLFTTTFGYGGCGYVTTDAVQSHLHVRLCADAGTLYAAATILLLTMSLGWPFTGEVKRNRDQALTLETSATHRANGWGHAVHGYVSR